MKRIWLVLALCSGLLVFGAGTGNAQEATAEPEMFSGQLALAHVADQVAVGPRPTASAGIIQAGNTILDNLDALGWQTSEDWHLVNFASQANLNDDARQTLSDWKPMPLASVLDDYMAGLNPGSNRLLTFDQLLVPVRNLVANYGTGPVIIIGAHYDTRIYADN